MADGKEADVEGNRKEDDGGVLGSDGKASDGATTATATATGGISGGGAGGGAGTSAASSASSAAAASAGSGGTTVSKAVIIQTPTATASSGGAAGSGVGSGSTSAGSGGSASVDAAAATATAGAAAGSSGDGKSNDDGDGDGKESGGATAGSSGGAAASAGASGTTGTASDGKTSFEEGEVMLPKTKKAAAILAGFRIKRMTMADAETGAVKWSCSEWGEQEFTKEITARVPQDILKCHAVSREIAFYSKEVMEEFHLVQRVFLHGSQLEEWHFHFGFVIPGSTNTWQQTIEAADEAAMIPAAVLSGNVTIETSFFDGNLLVSKSLVRVFYE